VSIGRYLFIRRVKARALLVARAGEAAFERIGGGVDAAACDM
jgi:hypothetical protein